MTTCDPNNLQFPASATDFREGTWVLSGSCILMVNTKFIYYSDLGYCIVPNVCPGRCIFPVGGGGINYSTFKSCYFAIKIIISMKLYSVRIGKCP